MRIHTLLEYRWKDGGLVLVREEGHEYDGPVALCDRGQSQKVANQGMSQSAQNQTNAQNANTSANTDLNTYSSNLNKFMNFGRKTYGANGTFMKDQNAIATGVAKAGSDSIAGQLAMNAARTGENTANYAPTVAAAKQAAEQNLTTQLAGADASRLQQLSQNQQFGVTASALPAQVQQAIYGTSVGGAAANLNPAASAAAAPSTADVVTGDILAAGSDAAGIALCPCEDSIISMASKLGLVQSLKEGDLLFAGIGVPANKVLEMPMSKRVKCFEIQTEGGRVHRGSATHTVELAVGGYDFLPNLMGQQIETANGIELVTKVTDIGEQTVYPIMISGSHRYLADGIWVLA